MTVGALLNSDETAQALQHRSGGVLVTGIPQHGNGGEQSYARTCQGMTIVRDSPVQNRCDQAMDLVGEKPCLIPQRLSGVRDSKARGRAEKLTGVLQRCCGVRRHGSRPLGDLRESAGQEGFEIRKDPIDLEFFARPLSPESKKVTKRIRDRP